MPLRTTLHICYSVCKHALKTSDDIDIKLNWASLGGDQAAVDVPNYEAILSIMCLRYTPTQLNMATL